MNDIEVPLLPVALMLPVNVNVPVPAFVSEFARPAELSNCQFRFDWLPLPM
jgi:hypothetical protein